MQAIDSNDPEAAEQKYRQVVKRLDQVSATGTIHKRTAARKKSRLARRLNNLKAQNA
jgi:small subunit ribosomal protein S20